MRSWILFTLPLIQATRIVQSNDDGWSESNLRTLFNVYDQAGYELVLSAPAENQSGTGSRDEDPQPVGDEGCLYQSCPPNSPAIGSDPSDPRLNYVNSFPVTSIKEGINVLGPKLWNGSRPELAVTGPNVGSNIGVQVGFSGTVGAAVFAVKEAGIPAIAFSGVTGPRTSFSEPTPLSAKIYADLALNVTTTILNSGAPYLPDDVWLNVNFPAVSETRCNHVDQFKFVFSRINVGLFSAKDVEHCGTDRLPSEYEIILTKGEHCIVSISPGDANDKTTIDAARQALVLPKLAPILSCL